MSSVLSASDFGKVALLMGGDSAEREISLRSGAAILAALQRHEVDVHAVDAGIDVLQRLSGEAFERAFIILHGRGGEDGVIQGVLECIGLPYTGSGIQSSALGMDKWRTKALWRGLDLPTPASVLISGVGDLPAAERLGYPQIIKPCREGSSIGMAKVEESGQLRRAWEAARQFDPMVMAEAWVNGCEYTASLLQGEALPLIRLETPHTIYDYEAKYHSESTRYYCPCGLPESQERELQALCLRAFEAVGASGWGRVDLMLDESGQPWLLEVNTVPGMTDHSLVPMAAQAAGIDFDDLVMRILATSLERETV